MKEKITCKGKNKKALLAALFSVMMIASVGMFSLAAGAEEETISQEEQPLSEDKGSLANSSSVPINLVLPEEIENTGTGVSPVSVSSSSAVLPAEIMDGQEEKGADSLSDQTEEPVNPIGQQQGEETGLMARGSFESGGGAGFEDDPVSEPVTEVLPDIQVSLTVNEAYLATSKKRPLSPGSATLQAESSTGWVPINLDLNEFEVEMKHSIKDEYGSLEIKAVADELIIRYSLSKAITDPANLVNDGTITVENFVVQSYTYRKKGAPVDGPVGNINVAVNVIDDQTVFLITKEVVTVKRVEEILLVQDICDSGETVPGLSFTWGADNQAGEDFLAVSLNDSAEKHNFVLDTATQKYTCTVPNVGTFTANADYREIAPTYKIRSFYFTPVSKIVESFKATFFAKDGDGDVVNASIRVVMDMPPPAPLDEIAVGKGNGGLEAAEAGLPSGTKAGTGIEKSELIELPVDQLDPANFVILEESVETIYGRLTCSYSQEKNAYVYQYILSKPVDNKNSMQDDIHGRLVDGDMATLTYKNKVSGAKGDLVFYIDIMDDAPKITLTENNILISKVQKTMVAKDVAVLYGADGKAAKGSLVAIEDGKTYDFIYDNKTDSYIAEIFGKGKINLESHGEILSFTPANDIVQSFSLAIQAKDGDSDIVVSRFTIKTGFVDKSSTNSESVSSSISQSASATISSSISSSSVPVSSSAHNPSSSATVSTPESSTTPVAPVTPGSTVSSSSTPARSRVQASSSTASSSRVQSAILASSASAGSGGKEAGIVAEGGAGTGSNGGQGNGTGGTKAGGNVTGEPQSPKEWEAFRASTLEEIKSEGVPTFTLNGNDVPLYGGMAKGIWALFNLILAIVGIATTAVLLVVLLIEKRKTKEEPIEDGELGSSKPYLFRSKVYKFVACFAGLASFVLFLITENMKNLMVLFDVWTPVMILLVLVQITLVVLARKRNPAEAERKIIYLSKA